MDEGGVHTPRNAWTADGKMSVRDGVHMSNSRHYDLCAQDLMLYIDGVWISDGGHPAWLAIGKKAESLGLSWGGRFKSVDSNHVSLKSPDGRM